MNKQKFVNLINNNDNVSVKDVDALEAVTNEYPYCQVAHILLANIHLAKKTVIADDKLHMAAVHAIDRGYLKKLIEKSTKTENEEVIVAAPILETAVSEIVETAVPDKVETVIPEIDASDTQINTVETIADTPILSSNEQSVPVEEVPDEVLPENIQISESESASDLVLQTEENISKITPNNEVEAENSIYKELQANMLALKAKRESNTETAKLNQTPDVSKTTTASKKEAATKTSTTSKRAKKTAPASSTSNSKAGSSPAKKRSKTSPTSIKKIVAKKKTTTKATATKVTPKKTTPVKKKTEPKINERENGKIIAGILKKSKKTVQNKAVLDQNTIIDKFIEEEPSISRVNMKGSFNMERQKDLAINSVIKGDDLISENLALILVDQGKKTKAIEIYKKLIWKFPQKKAFFASQIEELKK